MKRVAAAICALAALLSGCASKPAEQTETLFAMSTMVTLTAYGDNAEAGIDNAHAAITNYEQLLSVTDENSDIYRANNAVGESVPVAIETAALVFWAKDMCAVTGGSLDISVYPIVRAWGFTSPEYRVPQPEELQELLKNVDYSRIGVETIEAALIVPDGAQIDLGAVAKGYIGDRAIDALRESGVESAIINLGGNVQTLGTKAEGELWKVAVRDPKAPNEYLGVVSIGEGSVVTSGGYERFFTDDEGKTYHHIIDPETGYPADSGLLSVTVIGYGTGSGFYCDALTTAMFVMGKDSALDLWRRLGGEIGTMSFDLILVTDDGEVIVTETLEKSFELTARERYRLASAGR